MRLKTKALVFYAAFMGLPYLFIAFAMRTFTADEFLVPGIVWIGVVGVSQYFMIRCPRACCRRCAFSTPDGHYTLFVGTHCRHCGQPY